MDASIIWTKDKVQLRMGAKGTGRLVHRVGYIDTPASIEAATAALYDEARMRGLQIVQPFALDKKPVYKVTLVDDETGDMDPVNAAFFADATSAEALADARNRTDPELVDGQFWSVRDIGTPASIGPRVRGEPRGRKLTRRSP